MRRGEVVSKLGRIVSQFIPESELSSPHSKQDLQRGTPVRLLELVSYQEKAIVSRTFKSDSKFGSITMFAFDQGQGLSEHRSPFDAFVQVLEGNVEITISGQSLQASGGEVVILPANEPHALKALSRFKMLLVMIRR